MSAVAPETANHRLKSAEFLSAPTDVASFERLRLEIEALRLPTERVEMPSAFEAGAWAKAFSIYRQLKRRRQNEAAAPAPEAINKAQQERDWNAYLAARVAFLAYLRQNPISADMCEYVCLEQDDLAEPTIGGDDERFAGCPHPEWRNRFTRIEAAHFRLRTMTMAERAAVPSVMEGRRLIAAVEALQKSIKSIDAKQEWLDQRISTLEAQFSAKH